MVVVDDDDDDDDDKEETVDVFEFECRMSSKDGGIGDMLRCVEVCCVGMSE